MVSVGLWVGRWVRGGLLGSWVVAGFVVWVGGFVLGLWVVWWLWFARIGGNGLQKLWFWVARIAEIGLLEFWVVEIDLVLAGIMGWFAEIGLLELWVAKIGLLELVRC